MKKVALIILCVLPSLVFAGCSSHKVTEPEFKIVWQAYLSKEFEESFDERQSQAQKQKLLEEIVVESTLDYNEFILFMKKNHPEKYKSLF
jgi:hypothetical protein